MLIQTFRPGALAILMAREGKLEEFYAAELEVRRQLGFPPFSRLIRLRGSREATDRRSLEACARAHPRAGGPRAGGRRRCWGPPRRPLARISGNYRYHVHRPYHEVLRGARARERRAGRVPARRPASTSRWTWTRRRCCSDGHGRAA